MTLEATPEAFQDFSLWSVGGMTNRILLGHLDDFAHF
jgi:hypothetical protein